MLPFQKQFLIPQRASGEGGGLDLGGVQQTKRGRSCLCSGGARARVCVCVCVCVRARVRVCVPGYCVTASYYVTASLRDPGIP